MNRVRVGRLLGDALNRTLNDFALVGSHFATVAVLADFGFDRFGVPFVPRRWRNEMKWVTRERPKTDRIACPWLIRRFIDPDAEIVYVPADQVLAIARRDGGRSFDADEADYTHRAGKCSFEVLIDEFDLGGDPALVRLSRIVHAADVSEDLASEPEGAGLLAIAIGGLEVEFDDHRLLERGSFVYDALYEYCRRS